MRRFRLHGEGNKTILCLAGSNLAAGAMWLSDPDYYGIGTLISIEDTGDGSIRFYKKPKAKQEKKERETKKARNPSLREPKMYVDFSF